MSCVKQAGFALLAQFSRASLVTAWLNFTQSLQKLEETVSSLQTELFLYSWAILAEIYL